jgi:hypothetical protein
MDQDRELNPWKQRLKLRRKFQANCRTSHSNRNRLKQVSIALKPAKVSDHLVAAISRPESGQITHHVAQKIIRFPMPIDEFNRGRHFARHPTRPDNYDPLSRHNLVP